MNSAMAHPLSTGDILTSGRGLDFDQDVSLNGIVSLETFRAPSELRQERPLWLIHTLDRARRQPGELAPELEIEFEDELRSYRSQLVITTNLITQVGDQYYGERAAGIGGAPAQVTGMKLGTGATATAKTGAGAALVTYKTGSQKVIDGGFPTSSLSVSSRQIQWKTSWGAGVINGAALAEVVLVIDVLADATSSAANTIARAQFGPLTLGALDTLAITWSHQLLGA